MSDHLRFLSSLGNREPAYRGRAKTSRQSSSGQAAMTRLLNLRGKTGEDFNALLTQFAIERFLYRLSQSSLADRVVLKGAMLF